MKPIFYLASGLLGIDGLLHLAKISAAGFTSAAMLPWIVTGIFGIIYLVIALLLIRRSRSALWAGVLVPLLGLLLTLVGMKPNPDSYTLAFIGLDIVVVLLCAYLIYTGRVHLGRVR